MSVQAVFNAWYSSRKVSFSPFHVFTKDELQMFTVSNASARVKHPQILVHGSESTVNNCHKSDPAPEARRLHSRTLTWIHGDVPGRPRSVGTPAQGSSSQVEHLPSAEASTAVQRSSLHSRRHMSGAPPCAH